MNAYWLRRILGWYGCLLLDHDWNEVFAGHEASFNYGEMQYEPVDTYKDVCFGCWGEMEDE